jgi:hypothetical protein
MFVWYEIVGFESGRVDSSAAQANSSVSAIWRMISHRVGSLSAFMTSATVVVDVEGSVGGFIGFP